LLLERSGGKAMRPIGASAIGLAALFLLALVTAVPASAAGAGRHDHGRVVANICQTGLAPEVTAGHDEFVAALDREGTPTAINVPLVYGYGTRQVTRNVKIADGRWGKTIDFGGPRPLEVAYLDCVQAR
jgi:hypothetical protein